MKCARIGTLAIILSTLTGCWSSTTSYSTSSSAPIQKKPFDFMKSMLIKSSGKTAVFCIGGDEESRHRLEAYITNQMKQQGFDAYEGRLQIPSSQQYSAEDLAKLLRKEGFQSIAQVTYIGVVPKDGLPDSLNFKLHSIPEPHPAFYSTVQTTLNIALQVLIQTLMAVATR